MSTISTPAPVEHGKAVKAEMETVKAVETLLTINGNAQVALNFVFAYRNAAMLAVHGSAKLEGLRDSWISNFVSEQLKREALAIARRLYATVNNIGPQDVKNITDNQLWMFMQGASRK